MSQRMLSGVLLVALLLIAPTAWAQPPAGTVVPGRFICLVDDSDDAFAIGQAAATATGGTLSFVYSHAVNGFAIQVPPGIVVANLRAQPGVIHVEPDLVMHNCVTIPTGVDRIDAEGVLGQSPPIDCSTAAIAIIDSGIDADHPDLSVIGGVRFFSEGSGPPWKRPVSHDGNFDDDNGHGTHCAGIAAAKGGIVGVAPGARLYAIKVLDSSGSAYMSVIVAGVDWLQDPAFKELGIDIRIANMSLGGQGGYGESADTDLLRASVRTIRSPVSATTVTQV